MNWQPRQTVQALRDLPLEKVLVGCGAQRDRADSKKWHTPNGVLSVGGSKFMNWSLGAGGGGAIDLVMHLRALDFQAAVAWLANFAGELFPALSAPAARVTVSLKLPIPDPSQLGRVRDYLVRQRSLPLELVEPMIESGTIYADSRANVVFLLRGDNGLAVGAELRGTRAACWRGLAPGSRRDLGFFGLRTGPPGALILCESAIDALSCRALHPQLGCVSTAGARPNPLWLAWLLKQGWQLYCGFDRDATGEQLARTMIALHPAIRRLRPQAHDWNDQLKVRQGLLGRRPLTTWKEETPASASLARPGNTC